MYISKAKAEAIKVLTLRCKVASKRYGAAEESSKVWHESWNDAASSQAAIHYILGDAASYAEVREQERKTLARFNIIAWEEV